MYRIRFIQLFFTITTFSIALLTTVPAHAVTVNLNTWAAEFYPAVANFPSGAWDVSPAGDTVTQTQNGQPTLFYSDFNAFNTEVTGTIRVTGGDDDYIGFALGFQPGDTSNSSANYLLIDWKSVTQGFDFGPPSNTPGTTAFAGLAVSQVSGIPTADEFWGHTDFASDPSGGLIELARGNTLGNVGWSTNTDYNFRFLFFSSALQVFVNDILEMDISGSFSDGRLAFYNFSQGGVIYSAFEADQAPPPDQEVPVPEPATLLLLGSGLMGLGVYRKKLRKK